MLPLLLLLSQISQLKKYPVNSEDEYCQAAATNRDVILTDRISSPHLPGPHASTQIYDEIERGQDLCDRRWNGTR